MVEVISQVKEDLKKFFKSIANDKEEWDGETRVCARGFYGTLHDFEFIFLLNLFSSVLPHAKFLFNVLQCKINDIKYCSVKVDEFKRFLNERRDTFDLFWEKCIEETISSNEDGVPAKRQRVADIGNDKKKSYCRLYFEVLDTMAGHISNRFSELHKLEFLALPDLY